MALTLDANLAAAQELTSRNPRVKILSNSLVDSLPMDGTYFNTSDSGEYHPSFIEHSNGRLYGVYARDNSSGTPSLLTLIFSDVDKTEWYSAQIRSNFYPISGLSMCEMTDGNLGIVYVDDEENLKALVSDTEGTQISLNTIKSWNHNTYWSDHPHVDVSGESYEVVFPYCTLASYSGSGEWLIKKMSSSNFTSWAGEVDITPTGLTPQYKKDNPFVMRPATGNPIMFFDYVTDRNESGDTITNLFRSEYSGGAWGAGSGLTSGETWGVNYFAPSAYLDTLGYIKLAYQKDMTVLTMAPGVTSGWEDNESYPNHMNYDSGTDRLFVANTYSAAGTKSLKSILVIDPDSWTIERTLNGTSAPAIAPVFLNETCWFYRQHFEGGYVVVGTVNDPSQYRAIMVYNYDSDTITNYYFDSEVTYSITQNVTWDTHSETTWILGGVWLDATELRVYCIFTAGPTLTQKYIVGYIDLTEQFDPITGMVSFNEVFYNVENWQEDDHYLGFILAAFVYIRDLGYVAFSSMDTAYSSWKGGMRVVDTATGSLVKTYNVTNYTAFPYRGVYQIAYYNGDLYCPFVYEGDYGEAGKTGIVKINLTTDLMTYIQPTYTSSTNYEINCMKYLGGGLIGATTGGYGLQIYDTNTGTWTEYSSSTVSGWPDDYLVGDVSYDSSSGTLFAGNTYSPPNTYGYGGIIAVNEDGAFSQLFYRTGTWTSSWAFDAGEELSYFMMESNPSLVVDSSDIMWCFWERNDDGVFSLKWDNAISDKDLTDYLTGPVSVEWHIDEPHTLSFSCSHGHLFDPLNLMSILAIYLRRGRRITLQFGERVGETVYYQNQGEFVVESSRISYRRNEYPVIEVNCRDLRNLWSEGVVVATEYYSGRWPESVLLDLVTTHGAITAADTDLPSDGEMVGSHLLYAQWLDQSLDDILKDILDHFGYFGHMDVDGKFTVKIVDVDGDVDHAYTDSTKILSYTPDDSYATYTNRVIVKGEGSNPVSVMFPVERVLDHSGTLGWWGCEETITHYYSDDQTKTCSNPYLVIIQDPKISVIFVEKGGGSITITEQGTNYVVVTVVAPNLLWVFIAAVAAMVAIGYIALTCDGAAGLGSMCGIYIMMLSLSMQVVCYILGCVANYSYEIWAQPNGLERMSFSASADDEEMQAELNGMIITETIDDPLCYDLYQCQIVASREIEILKAQRHRISFEKLAHLQDEVGDILQIQHPYTSVAMKVFVTQLKRTLTPAFDGDGSFIDEIEGWKLS